MKKYLSLIYVFLLFQLSYAQFSDDFSDGNFNINPIWSGDTSLFQVNSNTLQSNSSAAATYYLSTPSSVAQNSEWSFYFNFKFATSGANYCDVYLMSDNNVISSALNGYFVRIGTTTDEISLYKIVSGTETKIIDGTDGTINSSTNNPFNIKVTRDLLDNWTLDIDDGATGTFITEGTVNDNSVNSSSFFGIKIIQSSAASAVNNHFFDNFNVQAIQPDTTSPSIVSISILSSNQLDVLFSENLDTVSAQNELNYSVDNGIGNPSLALVDVGNSALVHLTFSNTFVNNTTYNLSANNIEDLLGNKKNNTLSFFYFLSLPATFGDVVFNELMPDPNPVVGLPDAEYLEIYNNSNETFSLKNWTLVNTTTSKTLPDVVLKPDSFIIICSSTDESLFSSYGNVIGLSSWAALTNGGDSLTLLDNFNNVIDVVNYSSSWYNDAVKDDGGWSLELINPKAPCGSGSSNWMASTSSSGGTPGALNSVFDTTADGTAPQFISLSIINDSTILFVFDEFLNSSAIANFNFVFSVGLIISNISMGSNLSEIKVVLNNPLVANTIYTVTISGVEDCEGNVIVAFTDQFGIGVAPQRYDVLISEIFADPTPSVGLPDAEYVELVNVSNKIIDLNNCLFVDNLDTMKLVNVQLLPNEYLILTSSSNSALLESFGNVYGGSFPGINNSGEYIALLNKDTLLIHSVNFSDSWYKDNVKKEGGWSLEMVDATNPCSGIGNWQASTDANGGTPGKVNASNASNPDLTAPEVEKVIVINSFTIRLKINELFDEMSLSTSNFSIDNGINVSSVSFDLANQFIYLFVTPNLQNKTEYKVTVSGINDCVGNTSSSADFIAVIPELFENGDIVINEVLFNPRTGGVDFVELYNRSSKYIDLKELSMIKNTENVLSSLLITSDYYILPPNDFVVLTENTDNIKLEYPKSVEAKLLEINDLPSYNDDKGDVILGFVKNDSIFISDWFSYLDDYHHPLLDDDNGVSLERIDYYKESNNPENWHSASFNEGFATPGYENSQNFSIGNLESEITVTPEVFTPDGDGNNDFTTINYKFNEPGTSLSIFVFDSHGRLIKELVKSQIVGREGFYQWDGTNDINEKSLVGYYIIFIEKIKTNGSVENVKKKVVLGAQF